VLLIGDKVCMCKENRERKISSKKFLSTLFYVIILHLIFKPKLLIQHSVLKDPALMHESGQILTNTNIKYKSSGLRKHY
jgi:hypothetical protein